MAGTQEVGVSLCLFTSGPHVLLCIKWRLVPENARRSNQSYFTSLGPFPQLSCEFAAARRLLLLHRLSGQYGLLLKEMLSLIENVFTALLSDPRLIESWA